MKSYNTGPTEHKFTFEYPSTDDPILIELRGLAPIEFDANSSELQKASDIIGYAHGLFAHDGDNTPSATDPVTILKEAQAGQSFRCVEYSLLANGLLWAHGIPARTIGLKTADVETREYGAGHVVIEFWSNDTQKWVMSDVQAGIIPKSDEKLLSAVELSEAVEQGSTVEYIPVTNSRFVIGQAYDEAPGYTGWIKEYLYFIDTPVHVTLADVDRRAEQRAMLVPLGVAEPKMFQGIFVMNAVYTHSVSDFYPIFAGKRRSNT